MAIYLDYAAATPMDHRVLAAMQPYFTDNFYNPSSTYMAGRYVKNDLRDARARIAKIIGARPPEVVFTAGATEANNLVIKGIGAAYPSGKILVSSIEHDSVLVPAMSLGASTLSVNAKGILNIDALRGQVTDDTVLISVMYANNEVGTIQPIKDISQLVAAVRKDRRARRVDMPLYLHTDAAQAANYLDLHVARLGVDFMTLNGGKIYGPKQAGILYMNAKARLCPLVEGGGQERGLRSGTENVAGFIGLARALEIAHKARQAEVDRLSLLQKIFFDGLAQIPNTDINGSLHNRLPNNVHVTFGGIDNERLLIQLDELGIMASAGSACSASNEEASHVLAAMGIEEAAARSSIRLTMGRQTTEDEVKKTVEVLSKLVAESR